VSALHVAPFAFVWADTWVCPYGCGWPLVGVVVAFFVFDGKATTAGRRSAVLQVAAFRAAGCRLSCREKPHNAPRYVAFRAVESRGGRWPWPQGAPPGAKKSGSSANLLYGT